jgi:hypothetical protein
MKEYPTNENADGYPSIEVFIEMINSASYQDILVHRSSALKDSRLIATIEGGK